MEKPKRTIKKGFKIVEGASKAKKPLVTIALIITSLFAKSVIDNHKDN